MEVVPVASVVAVPFDALFHQLIKHGYYPENSDSSGDDSYSNVEFDARAAEETVR